MSSQFHASELTGNTIVISALQAYSAQNPCGFSWEAILGWGLVLPFIGSAHERKTQPPCSDGQWVVSPGMPLWLGTGK